MLITVHRNDGAVDQPLGKAHLVDTLTKRLFEPLGQTRSLLVVERRRLGLGEVQVRLLSETKVLAIEGVEMLHHKFIPRILKQQHFVVPRGKHLIERAVQGRLAGRSQ